MLLIDTSVLVIYCALIDLYVKLNVPYHPCLKKLNVELYRGKQRYVSNSLKQLFPKRMETILGKFAYFDKMCITGIKDL